MRRKNYIHVIVGTHWDREWLHPFAYTQSLLIEMMDNLLDYMEKHPEYPYFHLDSQTVVVEDYCRVRPENRDRLEKLVRAGRILIGPYYSLPEVNHLTGESLIRNLVMGYRVAREFGGRMEAGYAPTGVGQLAQMPQILRSVGLDTFLFYRGLRQDRSRLGFTWRAPDGSKVLALRLTGPHGRAWFFAGMSVPVFYPKGLPQDGLLELHNDLSARPGFERSFFVLRDHGVRFDGRDIRRLAEELEEVLAADTRSNQLLAVHAIDYGGPEKGTPRLIEEVNKLAGYEKMRLSTFPQFLRAFRRSLSRKVTPVLEGELRDHRSAARDLLLGTPFISSVAPVKIQNRAAEFALSRWAEPWDAFAGLLTGRNARGVLENAWKDLLATHAHDSVGGQGTDEVIRDVSQRFDGVRQAADGVTDYALGRLARLAAKPKAGPNSVYLTVFNPSPFVRRDVVRIYVDMPFYRPDPDGNTDLPEIWADADLDRTRLIDTARESLEITDDSGRPADFTVEAVQPVEPVGISHPGWGGRRLNAHRYAVRLAVGEVSGFGYRVFTASFRAVGRKERAPARPISRARGVLENEHLKVRIQADGTLDIKHKETGRLYPGGHLFEYALELGASVHNQLGHARRLTGLRADIELVENNSLAATYRIGLVLKLPAGAVSAERAYRSRAADLHRIAMVSPGDMSRAGEPSRELVEVPVVSFVTLRKGSRRLDVLTRVDNRARDYRLRVLFPTGIRASESWADQAFALVRRPIEHPAEKTPPLEGPYAVHPSVSFAAVNDGRAGLAVLHLGLIEYEVIADKERTIALTLLRCYQDLNKKCGTLDYRLKASQLAGEHVFSYALFPHAGDVPAAGVHRETDEHLLPLKVLQSAGPGGCGLPVRGSLLTIGDDDLVVSAVKTDEPGRALIVRVWNPTGRAIRTTVSCARPIVRARLVDSLERPLSRLPVSRSGARVSVGPYKIVSWELTLKRGVV